MIGRRVRVSVVDSNIETVDGFSSRKEEHQVNGENTIDELATCSDGRNLESRDRLIEPVNITGRPSR